MKEEDLRKQAWDFFCMQAGQRLTTFNFYIAISSLLTTGLAASFKNDIDMPELGIVFGLMILIFSFVFWKLDERNRDLIKGAEGTLKHFELQAQLPDTPENPHIARRFLWEEYDTNLKKGKRCYRFWANHYSYSDCFKAIFATFALLGLIGFSASVVKMVSAAKPKHKMVEQGVVADGSRLQEGYRSIGNSKIDIKIFPIIIFFLPTRVPTGSTPNLCSNCLQPGVNYNLQCVRTGLKRFGKMVDYDHKWNAGTEVFFN